MVNELPKNWIECKLGEIVTSRKGKKPNHLYNSKENGYIPYILIDEMEGKTARYFTNESIPTVNPNDVLLVWDGSIGKCISGIGGAIGSTIVGLTPLGNIPAKFLEYFFKRINSFIKETSTGTGLQHINKNFFNICDIALPPLNEQKRIVDTLDTLMNKFQSANLRLLKIQQILKRFRQSVLAAAVSGKLTVKWRKEHKIKDYESVPEVPLNDLIEDLKYGTSQKSEKNIKGRPILRIPNISGGKILLEDLKYSLLPEAEYEKLKLVPGDILIIRSNGSVSLVGKSAIVSENERNFAYAGYLIRIRCNRKKILPEFLNLALSTYKLRLQIELPARSTSGVNNINSKEVKALLIPSFSVDEQKEIIQKVEELFRIADKLEERYKKAKTYTDKLQQSILVKAFRGELVPQDANDEPASILLQKIKIAKHPFLMRAALSAKIITMLRNDVNLGHVKCHKIQFLIEHETQFDYEIKYERQAAGPYDREYSNKFHKVMQEKEWFFEVDERGTKRYGADKKHNELLEIYSIMYKDKNEHIEKIINLFNKVDFDSKRAEAVATIYAIWNNMLIKKQKVVFDKILKEFYKWSYSKEKFTEEEIKSSFEWMNRKGLIPTGFGKEIK